MSNPNVALTQVNAGLRELWKQVLAAGTWPRAIGSPLWPAQYPAQHEAAPLFVGMNPSYTSKNEGLLRVRAPYKADLDTESRILSVMDHESAALGRNGQRMYPYFKKFSEVIGSAKWNHVDLIAVRHRNQNELKGALGITDDGCVDDKFTSAQLDLALQIIDALSPRVVIVVNALASTVLCRQLRLDSSWDPDAGFFRHRVGGRATPWLLSGMLTGQRALDNHSLKRLAWHVGRALREPDAAA